MDEVRTQLRRFIEDNFIMGTSDVALAETDSFLDRHILDSTGFLELIAHLEERYGIKVGDDEMIPENLDSIENLVRYITHKKST